MLEYTGHGFYILAAYGAAILLLMGLYTFSVVKLRTLRDQLADES